MNIMTESLASTQLILSSHTPSTSVLPVPICVDDAFGPFSECRFDFTLLFEQWILSSLPSFLLLMASPFVVASLYRREEKIDGKVLRIIKLIVTITNAFLHLALLVLWSLELESSRTTASIPASILNLIVAIQIVILSQYEHSRSVRPSTTLTLYLLFTTILDIPQARTLYLVHNDLKIAIVFSCLLAIKVFLLILENLDKRKYLIPGYRDLPYETTSGIISRGVLWWINGLILEGSKRLISLRDLFELDRVLTAECVAERMREAWESRSKPESRFTFIFAVWRGLYHSFAPILLPRLCLIGFAFSQPFLISRLLKLLGKPDDEAARKEGYVLIASTAFIYIGTAVSLLLSTHNLNRLITMFRAGTISLIYEKTLRLKDGSFDESSAVTLMGSDVDGITGCLEHLNEYWSRSLEIAIGIPLLTLQLGWVSIMPLVVVFLASFGSSLVAKYIAERRRLWQDATQHRIIATSSMLADMKILKMMGLTGVLMNIVQNERVIETQKMASWAWVMVWLNFVSNIPFVIAPAATFAVYAIQAYLRGSESLNTVQAFTSLALVTLVSNPASYLLAAVPNLAQSVGCFDRCQNFLLADSRVDERLSLDDKNNENDLAVNVKQTNIRPFASAEIILIGIDLAIKSSSIVMIVGPVGVGKSTLLKAILGEIVCDKGTISVASRKMAYCSQSPWLLNGTVQQAICGVMSKEFIDMTWYNMVLESCALTFDISKFPEGDQTVIGSRGIILSGGQKHRIALARALYSRSEIFLLDDILSALDKRTERHIVERLFGSTGLFKQLRSTVILVTHATQYLSLADQIIVLPKPRGTVEFRKPDEIKELLFLKNEDQDKFEDQNTLFTSAIDANTEKAAISDEARDLMRQTGDIKVYRYYFESIGWQKFLLFVFFAFINVFFDSFSNVWLKWWTDIDGRQIALFISVYFLIAIAYCVGVGGYGWAISVNISPFVGRKLHQVLLQTVMKAPQSFFSGVETGTILNRFSTDMGIIEGQLGIGVLITVTNLFRCLASAGLVAAGSPFVALTIPFFMVAIYFLQKVYLQTSRQLRLLELETRSPLFSHFLETLEGLPTIRAFGWQTTFASENTVRLDDSQKPYYLLFCIQQWLEIVLDLMVAAMATIVVALAVNLRFSTSQGLLGISMNNILSFNSALCSFVTGWTMLETSLGAIARLRDFESETPVEAQKNEDRNVPDDWPSKGLIEIQSINASYNPQTAALKNVTLHIHPGLKVGICGRTGSGKSSLVSALLRLLDISSGTIKIDSLDLSTLPRTTIRERLIAIPQDALHIVGTIRLNADPLSSNQDTEIIKALTKVHLWSILEERGGLDADLLSDSLSKGQQQLMALARALLRKKDRNGGVLLLDEATSSIDMETEEVLKDVIKEEFRDFTVITVAHRPSTILDSDAVAVMAEGKIVEFGKPGELMEKENSALRDLVGRS